MKTVSTARKAHGGNVTVDKPICPKCNTRQSYYRLKTKDYQCRACGNSWKSQELKKKKAA